MSKVVSGIGNAISGVVKGVVNVVKSVVSGVGDLAKSIAKSPLGKAILIAGAVYFGGAALAGGFGSSAAGGSFLSGMGAGVSSAASSLSSAWGAVTAGNFGQAASTIGNAWGTAGAAAGQAAGAGAMTVGGAVAPTAVTAPTVGAPTAAVNGGAASTVGTGAAAPTWVPSSTGMNVLASEAAAAAPAAAAPAAPGFFASDLAKYGAISAGTQVVGGMIQGAGQKQAQEDQRDYEMRMAQEARDRYNANVGTALWGSNQPVNPNTGLPGANAWDPQQAARDINARYAGTPSVSTIGTPGLINRNLATVQPGTPMANNNYPVYNPYYATPPGRG